MFRKVILATTAALAFGALGLMGGGGSASAASAISAPITLPALENGASGIQTVASRSNRYWRYDRRRHGDRFRYRQGRFNNFYRGYYYERPWWNLGSGVSIAIGGPGYYAPAPVYYPRPVYRAAAWGPRHVNWCFNHYRSYNPNNNLFLTYDGYRRCRSPFSG